MMATEKANYRRDAAAILKDNIPKIMSTWAIRVRRDTPAAGVQDEKTLFNGLPDFLNSLANVISTTGDSAGGERFVTENRENCRRHGAERASVSAYTLDQIIGEYKLLRETLFEVLEIEGILPLLEQRKLLGAIDCGITEAAAEFTELRGFSAARIKKADADHQELRQRLDDSHLEISGLKEERVLRDEFVSLLSHDLRTPLTAAKVSAELILRRMNSSDLSYRLVGRVIENIDRTDHMIRDLLDANRIHAGERLPLNVENTDLVALAKSTIESLTNVYGRRFKFIAPPEMIGNWSPDDLKRVIENLITNAVKYGDPHRPITITMSQLNNKASIAVHNEGIPIPQQSQRELFQKHKRSSSAQTGGKRGWGLGLTLVQGIVQAHNGTVRVESEQERGTTFIVELPTDLKVLH